MKKQLIVFTLSLIFISFQSNAQLSNIGAYVGFNSANVRFSGNYDQITGNSILGLQIGALLDFPVNDNVSIMAMPGVGGKGTAIYGYKVSYTYLDIPLYGIYKYELGNGKLFGGMGIYLGYALSGKVDNERIDFGLNGDLKRGDAGLGFIAGYELTDLGIKAMLTLSPGVTNINPDNGTRWVNNAFGVRLAYMFNR